MLTKKCRRCYEELDRSSFREGKQICRECNEKATALYKEMVEVKKSSKIKSYADDIVRQFYKGSSTSLMCACRELVKHYEKFGVPFSRDKEEDI